MIKSVKKIKEKLGINNFDDMTYEQFKEFVEMIPIIDKELAKDIINQIPQLLI